MDQPGIGVGMGAGGVGRGAFTKAPAAARRAFASAVISRSSASRFWNRLQAG